MTIMENPSANAAASAALRLNPSLLTRDTSNATGNAIAKMNDGRNCAATPAVTPTMSAYANRCPEAETQYIVASTNKMASNIESISVIRYVAMNASCGEATQNNAVIAAA